MLVSEIVINKLSVSVEITLFWLDFWNCDGVFTANC